MGERAQKLVERAPERAEALVCSAPRCTAPISAAPVANSISVSEVEVSLSTVMALNERSTDFESIACSAAEAIGASVNT